MPLSRRWANYQTDDLYRAWRAGRLSYNAFDAYAVTAAAEILSNIYSTAAGGSLGSPERIEKDFEAQAIMKMLKELDVLAAQAEAGNGVFADEPEPKAAPEAKTDPRQETPEERAAEAGLVKHPSAEPETLGRSCKGCAFYKPAGKPKGRGECTNAYVKQPVAADWYCKHWKAASAAADGTRVKANGSTVHVSNEGDVMIATEGKILMNKVKARISRTAVFDLDGTIITDPDTFPGFGTPNQDVVARMQRCLDAGIEVLVHSCRWSAELNDPELAATIKGEVEAWLRENNIPFTGLYASDKPMAVFYCDDRGVHPSDLSRLDRLIDEAIDQLKPEKDPGNDSEVRAAEKAPKHLPGSKHWNDPDDKYDAKALSQGVEIELEHTTDRELAKQIAKDHLSEDPQYYEKLKKVEANLLFKAGRQESVFNGRHWISPDGDVFKVDGDHGQWAIENCRAFENIDGELFDRLRVMDPEHESSCMDARSIMVSLGWCETDYDTARIGEIDEGMKALKHALERLVMPENMDLQLLVETDEGEFDTTPRKVLKTGLTASLIKITAHVKKRGNKWVVTNKAGTKTLGTHDTKEEADAQLAAIEMHKHASLERSIIFASDGKFDWACLMIDYPEDLAKRVMAWGAENIADDVIYDPEADRSYGRESHIHTTVAYGIEPEVKLADIKSALGDRLGVVKAKLGKVTKFATNPDYDVIKIDVLSPDLHALHQAVEDTIGAPGNSFPDYKPHLTIAYVKPGSCDHLLDTSPFEGEEFELSDFDFSDPNSSHEKFSVKAGLGPAQGVRVAAKRPFRSILFTAEPLLNRLAKLAKETVESDPAFAGYEADPAKAERLGAIQQNLSDARSEEELRQAWDAAGLSISYDELRQRAENLSE